MNSPQIDCAAIIGVGLIGGSFGMALKKRGLVGKVVGVGRNPKRLQLAQDLGAIDSWSVELDDVIPDCDLVYISTPVGLVLDFVKKVSPLVKADCIITDAGSTKADICRGADAVLGDRHSFVGGHPMAGSEVAGVETAHPDLFVGATYVLTPTTHTKPASAERMRSIAESIGSRVLSIDPEGHDRCTAVISHLPHVIAAAMISMTADHSTHDPEVFDFVAGSFRDMTRVAGSSPELWRDICFTNAESILSAAKDFRKALDAGLDFLESGNSEGFERWFSEAKEIRDSRVRKPDSSPGD